MNTHHRRLGALLLGASMALAACGGSTEDTAATETSAPTTEAPAEVEETTTTEAPEDAEELGGYPVELAASNGDVVIAAKPERIVSLSASSTEMLFAIGAGDQVVAVDSFSNYPAEAPLIADLSAFDPNFEAISAFEPDLVVTSFDSEDALKTAFAALDIPVLVLPSAITIDDTYAQIADLGVVTDHVDEAAAVNADIRNRVEAAIERASNGSGAPVKVYHELDDTFFSVSSASFIGDLYAKMGFENVSDPADPDGYGYPQVTPEFLVEANPDLIVITDQVGYTADDVAARPGWDVIAAVENANIVSLDADVASRWGPRVADLAELLADLSAPVVTG